MKLDYKLATFESIDAQTSLVVQYIRPFLQQRRKSFSLLDIGCGAGSPISSLATSFPKGSYLGVDISETNIVQARKKAKGQQKNLTFQKCDYLTTKMKSFDFIISDSTLHLLGTPPDVLLTKIRKELKPGGITLFTVPYSSFLNSILFSIRSIYRVVSNSFFDSILLFFARIVNRDIDRNILLDRIAYMSILPAFVWNGELIKWVQREGFTIIMDIRLPLERLGKAKHAVVALQRN